MPPIFNIGICLSLSPTQPFENQTFKKPGFQIPTIFIILKSFVKLVQSWDLSKFYFISIDLFDCHGVFNFKFVFAFEWYKDLRTSSLYPFLMIIILPSTEQGDYLTKSESLEIYLIWNCIKLL